MNKTIIDFVEIMKDDTKIYLHRNPSDKADEFTVSKIKNKEYSNISMNTIYNTPITDWYTQFGKLFVKIY